MGVFLLSRCCETLFLLVRSKMTACGLSDTPNKNQTTQHPPHNAIFLPISWSGINCPLWRKKMSFICIFSDQSVMLIISCSETLRAEISSALTCCGQSIDSLMSIQTQTVIKLWSLISLILFPIFQTGLKLSMNIYMELYMNNFIQK